MRILCYVLIFANSCVCLRNIGLIIFYLNVRILVNSLHIELKLCM
jgi:hypothetical protein